MFGTDPFDDDTIRLAAEGDAAAAAVLVGTLQDRIRMMIAARLSPTPTQLDAVDDIAQDVSLGLAAGLPRLERRTVAGLRAFVSGIVAHQVNTYFRETGEKRRRMPGLRSLDSTIGAFSEAGPLWALLSSGQTSPSSAAERAERTARLLGELGRLKDEHRTVITLAIFDQLTPSEIGKQMGRSRGAIAMLLLRAVGTLRSNMAATPKSGASDGTST